MKRHFFTRSLFVVIAALFVCVSIYAVDLNPFAYRIDNIVEKSGGDIMNDHIEINYSLSGVATEGWIRFWDISDDANPKSTWTRKDWKNTGTCLAEFKLTGDYLKKGEHTFKVDFTDVIGLNENNVQWQKVRWTIDVKGGNQNTEYTAKTETRKEATGMTFKGSTTTDYAKDVIIYTDKSRTSNYINAVKVDTEWSYFYPGGLDICTNPYDYNFGVVLCPESKKTTRYFERPALYAFGGAMEHLPTYYNGTRYTGYSGSISWGVDSENWASGVSYYAFGPHRVRFTEDGRVFVSAMVKANKFLYEVTKPSNVDGNNFYESNNGGSFRNVFPNNTYDATSATLLNGGTFVVGPNMAFDVRGTGSALKLLLMSTAANGIVGGKQNVYRTDEYSIGTNPTITAAPSTQGTNNLLYNAPMNKQNQVPAATKPHNEAYAMVIGHDNTGIEYDPYGGYWIAQCRIPNSGALATTLVHRTKNGVWEHDEHAMRRGKGAIRHNYDNTKLAVAGGVILDTIMHIYNTNGSALHKDYYANKKLAADGRAYKTKVVERNQITIWDVSYNSSTGAATMSNPKYINTGLRGAKDIAWDFADNLYVIDPNVEVLTAFALPHKDKTVSTPCREVYNFTLAPIYTFGVSVDPVISGYSFGYVKQSNRTNKTANGEPYPYYMHNAVIELTAAGVPEGCRLYTWTNKNGNANTKNGEKLVLTGLTKDEEVTAHIGLCVYENKAITTFPADVPFPGAFVRRELDSESFSTICLPFDIKSLIGTPYEGATVMRFDGTEEIKENGVKKVNLLFEKVAFSSTDYMEAGVPYLIKVANNIPASTLGEKRFDNITCPKLSGTNTYGGLDVTTEDGFAFHGVMNPATFPASKTNLFLVADNRLANLYEESSINGLRGYFTVPAGYDASKVQIKIMDKTATYVEIVPEVSLMDSVKAVKYLWNGRIYIQRDGKVYDITGFRAR